MNGFGTGEYDMMLVLKKRKRLSKLHRVDPFELLVAGDHVYLKSVCLEWAHFRRANPTHPTSPPSYRSTRTVLWMGNLEN